MRIVRHPNIVQLKAFYYSNGERVRTSSDCLDVASTDIRSRKMRFIST